MCASVEKTSSGSGLQQQALRDAPRPPWSFVPVVFLRCGEVYKTTLTRSSYLTGILRLSQIKHCDPGSTLLYIVGPPQGLI